MIEKVKSTVLRTYVIAGRKGDEIVGTFYKKELKKNKQSKCKTNEKEYRIEKVINRKSNKLYVKFIF